MERDRKRHRKTNQKKQDFELEFGTFGIPLEHHAEFKAAILAAARAGLAEFPDLLRTVKEQLKSHDPMGCCAGPTDVTPAKWKAPRVAPV